MTFSGRLNDNVTFYTQSVSQDGVGQKTGSWSADFTVLGEVVWLQGKERFEADKLTEDSQVKIRIRWRSDVAITQRVAINSVWYDIDSIQEIRRRKALIIFAKIITNT